MVFRWLEARATPDETVSQAHGSVNLAFLVAPVLAPQIALEDLSAARQRELVDDLQTAPRLVARDQGLGVRAQLVVGPGGARTQDDDGVDTPPWGKPTPDGGAPAWPGAVDEAASDPACVIAGDGGGGKGRPGGRGCGPGEQDGGCSRGGSGQFGGRRGCRCPPASEISCVSHAGHLACEGRAGGVSRLVGPPRESWRP